jgi:S-adenosylmethionine/arginine decarboxylase-like enzyme
MAFGYELLLDLYDCKPGVCDDLELCYKFLNDIVDHLNMKKQAPPDIFFSDETKYPTKKGLSGWVPLIESSIVIHTLSLKNFITVDVYCCHEFNVEKAKEFVLAFFHPEFVESNLIKRGNFYESPEGRRHSEMKLDKK